MPNVTEVISGLQPLVIGGLPVAILIYLVVEGLLAVGLVKNETDSKRRATVIVAVVLAGVWTARVLSDAAAITTGLVIDTLFVALVGCLAAALIHETVSGAIHLARGEKLKPPEV
jgi:hypothetical protein